MITEYRGICDASAAVSVGQEQFLVANDEDNRLRLYRAGQPEATQSFPLDDFLKPDRPNQEADIEGSAMIGTRIYWITSHGANSNGKPRPSRHRLFATDFKTEGGTVRVTPAGQPYRDLLDDLVATPALQGYDFRRAAARAPEAVGGLNIEGLAATPSGALLIGFRNPVIDGRALLVPLENPAQVIEGKRPTFGNPIELDLGGRGIRSIESVLGDYLIVAGAFDDTDDFKLFRWSGGASSPQEVSDVAFGTLRPEALFVTSAGQVQILSDDGGRVIDGQECKAAPLPKRAFRSLTLTP